MTEDLHEYFEESTIVEGMKLDFGRKNNGDYKMGLTAYMYWAFVEGAKLNQQILTMDVITP